MDTKVTIRLSLTKFTSLVKDPSSDEKIAEEVSELRKKLNTALNKDNSAEVMGELKKIKDSLNKRPVAPAPKPAPKKKVTPIVAKDVSISELLSKIGATDAISGNDD